jgi:hypothetical protein
MRQVIEIGKFAALLVAGIVATALAGIVFWPLWWFGNDGEPR